MDISHIKQHPFVMTAGLTTWKWNENPNWLTKHDRIECVLKYGYKFGVDEYEEPIHYFLKHEIGFIEDSLKHITPCDCERCCIKIIEYKLNFKGRNYYEQLLF